MGNGDEGASYGFAPQGKPSQHENQPYVRRQPTDREPIDMPADHHDFSAKPPWVWLVIGILLGTGGTMAGSALWWQGSYVNPSVAMDTDMVGDDPGAEDGSVSESKTRSLAASRSLDADMPESAKQPLAGDPPPASEGQSEMLLVSSDSSPEDGEEEINAASTETVAASASADSEPAVIRSEASPDQRTGAGNAQAASLDTSESTPEVRTDPNAEDLSPQAVLESIVPNEKKPDIGETTTAARSVVRDEPSREKRPMRASERIYRVQLAAVNDEAAAEKYWREVTTRLPELFAEIEPIFDRRKVDERVFFRIWIGEFEQRTDADDYCVRLKSQGQDCFVTRG